MTHPAEPSRTPQWPGAWLRWAAWGLIGATSSLGAWAGTGGGATLCLRQERALFSCRTEHGKVISVCAGKDTAQYRFGRPGSVELAFPTDPGEGPHKLLWSHYSRPNVDRFTVRFATEEAEYSVFDWVDESGSRDSGVAVTRLRGGAETRIRCAGPALSRPGEAAARLRCDADSALATCP